MLLRRYIKFGITDALKSGCWTFAVSSSLVLCQLSGMNQLFRSNYRVHS
jgi:hypothetical protein